MLAGVEQPIWRQTVQIQVSLKVLDLVQQRARREPCGPVAVSPALEVLGLHGDLHRSLHPTHEMRDRQAGLPSHLAPRTSRDTRVGQHEHRSAVLDHGNRLRAAYLRCRDADGASGHELFTEIVHEAVDVRVGKPHGTCDLP